MVGDRPQKTLLESREPVFAGNTRADRVQGEWKEGKKRYRVCQLLLYVF